MQVVIKEKDFVKNKPYRIEIKLNDEKVAEILKYAKGLAKDGIINPSDVTDWISSAVEGNIYLSFPETGKFYYINPKCWRMDIAARLDDTKLAREIVTEICLKTAKNLTALLQADLKMHEAPPTIDEFIKANFENFPELRGRRIGYKEVCSGQTLEILVKYKKTLFENEDWTYDTDVDSIFDEQVDFIQFHIDTGSFVFEKTIENDQEGFYEKIVNSLLDVPMIGEALSLSFRKAYKNVRKDLDACKVAHNERARKIASEPKVTSKFSSCTESASQETSLAEILAKVVELHRKETEWKGLYKIYSQKLYNDEFRGSIFVNNYYRSREIGILKASMQKLENEIEELYARICSDLS